MKIRITGKIYGADRKPVPIGTEITVKDEPTGWAGRYEVVAANPKPESVAVTNPAPIDDDLDEITALRDEYEEVTGGGSADKRWKEDTLREKIAEAKAS